MNVAIGLCAGVALVSGGVGLYTSAQAIPKLLTYESKAQKAAEWSNIAEDQLWKTRFTVAIGVVCHIVSVVAALSFLSGTPIGFANMPIWLEFLMSTAQGMVMARMGSFWNKKAKVPLLDDYNDAISMMSSNIAAGRVASFSWCAMAVIHLASYSMGKA